MKMIGDPVCCSALQCVAVYCGVLQCTAVYCSVLQHGCNTLQNALRDVKMFRDPGDTVIKARPCEGVAGGDMPGAVFHGIQIEVLHTFYRRQVV
eukprot:CAMPEP_0179454250 /NCGR_PEP_ID=MMETSP0799-20121207/38098_1 /TAXON_ID=46947 /ORGANISM="Geminigera cryophila, Strain CCMP2564" /LENGTH=93 /DNA_ID=CAMNT_0021251909 /DNA_START=92 /DNA_END=373 /DNA_ORIENTATION=+